MSKRRYVLQKNFPNSPKGTIISWNPAYEQYMSKDYKHNHSECVFFKQDEIDRNPDWFLPEQPEVENKEWEILEFRNPYNYPIISDGNGGWYMPNIKNDTKCRYEEVLEATTFNGGNKIHSVKRNSDNEVFSVGDEVEYRAGDDLDWDEYWSGVIEKVYVGDSKKIIIDIHDKTYDHNPSKKYISNIRHPLPKSNSKDVFTWDEKLVKEMIYAKLPIPEHYAGNLQKCLDEFKQSKQPLKPDTKESKMPIKLSKEESNFIQATFNLTDNWYWTDFYFRRVGDCLYELWDAEKLPDYIKKVIRPKTYTQQQLDEAIQKAFEESRMYDTDKYSGDINDYKFVFKFRTFQDYINSLNTNTKTSKHWT